MSRREVPAAKVVCSGVGVAFDVVSSQFKSTLC